MGDGDGDSGDGDGDGDNPGDGDGDGDGDDPGDGDGDAMGGGGGMGGTDAGTGGMDTGTGGSDSVEVFGNPFGMGGTVVCSELPEECGDPDSYGNDPYFGTNGNDRFNALNDAITFYLDGNDLGSADSNGSCLVGGEGNDHFTMTNEGSAGDPDIYVGGPGADVFDARSFQNAPLKFIADFEPGADTITFNGAIFNMGSLAAATYVEIIADFDGLDASLSSEATRIVYDPNNGHLYADPDGNVTGEFSPTHFATIQNFADITVTKDDFADFTE